VNSLPIDHPILAAYKKAVSAMAALPESDPRNWTRQAQIHQDHCPHGNWFFLPWHRAYLHRFEELCRELSGVEAFALPYWNWTDNPTIPAAFWGDAENPLRHARDADENTPMPDFAVGQKNIDAVMGETSFNQFASGSAQQQRQRSRTGALEGGPHNVVHGTIGGDMGSYMSPLDPLFWLHHCNVDRIWRMWNLRGNRNARETSWTGFVFRGDFVDRQGQAVDTVIENLLDTEVLGYRYDTDPEPAATIASPTSFEFRPIRGAFAVQGIGVGETTESLFATSDREAVGWTGTFSANLQTSRRAYADIGGFSADSFSGYFVKVFVNCAYLSDQTPADDDHYAGCFAFFGREHADHSGTGVDTVSIDLTAALERLGWDGTEDAIEVQLLPSRLPKSDVDNIGFSARNIQIRVTA
jgi:tyrosinase